MENSPHSKLNINKKWFIFRHFNHFIKVFCKDIDEARLLIFAKRRKDFYYYEFVATRDTKFEAKEYCRFNKGTPYKKLNSESKDK